MEPSEFEQIKNQLVDGQYKKLQALKIDTETRNILAEKLENEMHQYELYYKQQYDFKVLTDTITVAPNFSGADVSGLFRCLTLGAAWCILMFGPAGVPPVSKNPHFSNNYKLNTLKTTSSLSVLVWTAPNKLMLGR